jgi:hypothetical protein
MKTKILLFVSLISFAFFIGCTTNEKVDVSSTSNTISTDDVVANSEIDATVDDVSSIAEDQYDMQSSPAAKTSAPRVSMLPACAIITTVLTNDSYTRTVDFGTQGCTLNNGNVVKGKIIISFTKDFTAASKTISYTLEGFYHNGNLIEGSKTITRELKSTDILAAIHPVTTHTVDVKITFPDGKVYSRIGTRVREMVEGMTSIANWEDNVYKVWGYHITTFPNGSKYTSITEKTQPLVFNMSCRKPFPVSGIVTITKNDGKAVIDYGNGECDNLATITVKGVTKEITLKK